MEMPPFCLPVSCSCLVVDFSQHEGHCDSPWSHHGEPPGLLYGSSVSPLSSCTPQKHVSAHRHVGTHAHMFIHTRLVLSSTLTVLCPSVTDGEQGVAGGTSGLSPHPLPHCPPLNSVDFCGQHASVSSLLARGWGPGDHGATTWFCCTKG